MQFPLEIAFHNLPSTPWAEEDIRDRVAKLDERYGHLIGCRVRVEREHNSHRTGNGYQVHIELSVPGKDLVVSKEPHGAGGGERLKDPDLGVVIRHAFKAAERQLDKHKKTLSGEVKHHEPQFLGQVSIVDVDHAFLLTNEGVQLYFHANSVLDGQFATLKIGDKVHYIAADGDTGPTAVKVWPAAESELI